MLKSPDKEHTGCIDGASILKFIHFGPGGVLIGETPLKISEEGSERPTQVGEEGGRRKIS